MATPLSTDGLNNMAPGPKPWYMATQPKDKEGGEGGRGHILSCFLMIALSCSIAVKRQGWLLPVAQHL